MLRKLAILAMAGLIILSGTTPAFAASPPPLRGKAMLLMDALTGQILYQQNGTVTNYPASTTKLLTALVAVEHGRLDQTIRVSREAVDKEPDSSSCYISEGEEQPLEYMLYGLLLPSGNDCADAIAEGVSGGNPGLFVAWMNETAKRLGATNSHFQNPHGLHDPNHYTTALDLALIARGALANPIVRKISSTKEFVWPGKNNGTYYNHNLLLWTYPDETRDRSVVGGKTGYTEAAGFTLVVAAEEKGRQLIGVLMGYEDKAQEFEDMAALLDYGFENFVHADLIAAGAPQGEIRVVEGEQESVPVVAASAFTVARPRDGREQVTVIPRLQPELKAPVAQGEQVGQLEVREGDRLLGTVPVVTAQAVLPRPALGKRAGQLALTLLQWLGLLLAGLLMLRLTVRSVRRVLRHRRRQSLGGMRATGTRGVISGYRPRSFR